MKDPKVVSVDDVVRDLGAWDAILDARSPSEWQEDHLPGAINTPVLDDDERARIGTMYKQHGAFAAKRTGAATVSRNIANILESTLARYGREWAPLVYCWRGGNRSGALSTVLARIGWRTSILDGGYREFRRRVMADLDVWPARFEFRVVTGRTGSGKSALLERLDGLGAQVLDLERLALHRGSVLGQLPDRPQPSQKRFDTLVWDRLRTLDPARPVFVESESRKVGACQVPSALIERMRASPCLRVTADDTARTRLLLTEYRHFVDDPQRLAQRLQALVPLHGRERVEGWLSLAHAGRWEEFVQVLLHEHYDPLYDKSMQRNFAALEQAPAVNLTGNDGDAIESAALELMKLAGEPRTPA